MNKIENLYNLIDNLLENETDEVIITQLNMAQVMLTEEFNKWLKKKWEYIQEEGLEQFEDIMELKLHPTDW